MVFDIYQLDLNCQRNSQGHLYFKILSFYVNCNKKIGTKCLNQYQIKRNKEIFGITNFLTRRNFFILQLYSKFKFL